MVHIYGHSWPIRWGGEGETKTIKVYSNCPRVELFVNGVSQGVRRRDPADFPASGLRWDVELEAGVYDVRAVAHYDDRRVEDSVSFVYETRQWGAPAMVKLSVAPVVDNDDDGVWVEAQLVDAAGVPCLDSRAYIEFSAAGDGHLIDNQGTSDGSRLVQAYNGRARIRVAAGSRSVGAPGGVAASPRGDTHSHTTVVAASSPSLPTAFVTVGNRE